MHLPATHDALREEDFSSPCFDPAEGADAVAVGAHGSPTGYLATGLLVQYGGTPSFSLGLPPGIVPRGRGFLSLAICASIAS